MIAPLNKSESKIQSEILNHLNKLDKGYFFKTIVCNRGGVPDIVGVYMGFPVFIEVKSLKGKLSSLQENARDRILDASGIHITARSLHDVLSILSDLRLRIINEN